MKTFTLYLDYKSFTDQFDYIECHKTYDETEQAIDNGEQDIKTTSLASLTFDLLTLGYQIFVVRNGVKKEFYPGMESKSTEKDIKFQHNIMKLIRAKVFDKDFE